VNVSVLPSFISGAGPAVGRTLRSSDCAFADTDAASANINIGEMMFFIISFLKRFAKMFFE